MTKIALYQSNTGIDPEANATALIDAVSEAVAGGAEMLFTPEMSGLLDRDSARAAKILRRHQEDEVLAAAQKAAADRHIWLHIGSLAVPAHDETVANRSFVRHR